MLSKNQKGFSLVEVMISMVILAMLSLPLLTFFANSAKTGVTAAQMQSSTSLADSLMEEMKAHADIASMLSYNVRNAGIDSGLPAGAADPDTVTESAIYQTDGTLGVSPAYMSSVSNSGVAWKIPETKKADKYYLEHRNIIYGSHTYDARIEINTLGNSSQPDKFKNGGTSRINDRKLPEIQLVGSNDSVSALQSRDEASNSAISLKLLLQSIDNAEAEAEFARTNPGETYSGTMPYRSFGSGLSSELGYVSKLERTIKVDISPYKNSAGGVDLDRTVVTVWPEYSCKYNPVSQAAVDAAPAGTYPKTCMIKGSNIVQATTLTKDFEKLYLFLYSAAKTEYETGPVTGLLDPDMDNVEVTVSSDYSAGGKTPPKPSLYLVYQMLEGMKTASAQTDWQMNITGGGCLEKILTNISAGNINSDVLTLTIEGKLILEQNAPNDRIVNIKVDIYDAGYLHKSNYNEHLRTTFESTVSLAE